MPLPYQDGDSQWDILRKLLINMVGTDGNGGLLGQLPGPQGSDLSFATQTDITVAAAGTRVNAPGIATPRGVIISPRSGNTGTVYVGDKTVTNAAGTKVGIALSKLASPIFLLIPTLNLLWFDADTSGDKVGIQIL